MRLIDADALKEKVFFYELDSNSYVEESDIDAMPTIDAVPVVHGEWYRPKEWSTKTYRRLCTNCHDVAYFCGSGNYRYCPNCGAKMKGERRC